MVKITDEFRQSTEHHDVRKRASLNGTEHNVFCSARVKNKGNAMSPEPLDARQALTKLCAELRSLHRALVKVAQAEYELGSEPISGPVELLQLLTTHPHFAWLHPLSELMVGIDEVLDQEAISEADKQAIMVQVKSLLSRTDDNPHAFSIRYLEAMHKDPAVAIAHSSVREILASR